MKKDQEIAFHNLIVPPEKTTRVEIHSLSFEMFPKKDKVVEMKCLTHCDPKLWFAPNLFINYIFKKVIGLFLEKIFKFSQTIEKKAWGPRMVEKKDLYDWLKSMVGNFLGTLQGKDAEHHQPLLQPAEHIQEEHLGVHNDNKKHGHHPPSHHHNHVHKPGEQSSHPTRSTNESPDSPREEF